MDLQSDSKPGLELIAQKELYRIEEMICQRCPNLTILPKDNLEGWDVIVKGSGPKIHVKSGYVTFRMSYNESVKKLVEQICATLPSKRAGLVLIAHYQVDSDLNVWGDYMWHKFIILKRPNIFAFWFRKFKNLFKKS